jgi:hypothetical protein
MGVDSGALALLKRGTAKQERTHECGEFEIPIGVCSSRLMES